MSECRISSGAAPKGATGTATELRNSFIGSLGGALDLDKDNLCTPRSGMTHRSTPASVGRLGPLDFGRDVRRARKRLVRSWGGSGISLKLSDPVNGCLV